MNIQSDPLDISNTIKAAISRETGIPADQLDPNAPFERFGIESVLAVSIVRRLEETFGDLSKTLLFEFQSISALRDYFIEEYAEISSNPAWQGSSAAAPLITAIRDDEEPAVDIRERARPSSEPDDHAGHIAIVGISGRFPLARDLDAFWRNLSEKRDCITEIPERLWNWRDYWHPDRNVKGKSYSKWGGFIEDSDCFDPLFFNISNLQAESMDPQERIFLETVYHTLEDAGYTRRRLANRQVGLYVAAMWGGYQHLGACQASTDSSFASIANRASYFFDLHGPSMALDTTCSGSLTALHLACESLRNGESDLAIAGGVNVTSHPHKYLALCRTGFAATDGRCRSFGADGSGYVPGDGCCAVLLKPLKAAIADNDRIHAVIRASSINHSGRSSGFTVPSAEAQSELILRTLRKADVDPRTISYVEAHAAGTALGDPIEIRGLTNAFRKYTNERGFCAIGSVKSNIGHLESAAGIAGIAKVVLQLRHRQLAPSIHSDTLNPNIPFETTPFYVQRQLSPWLAPVIETDGHQTRVPRRAAVSAFGAGGSNAHVILEEYAACAPSGAADVFTARDNDEQLIVLSARTAERLRVVIGNLQDDVTSRLTDERGDQKTGAAAAPAALLDCLSDLTGVRAALLDPEDRLCDLLPGPEAVASALRQLQIRLGATFDARSGAVTVGELSAAADKQFAGKGTAAADATLRQIAYSLQTGREHMEFRFAVLANSLLELREKLAAHLAGETVEQAWSGKVQNAAAVVANREEEKAFVDRLVEAGRLARLGKLWTEGVVIPWEQLHGENPTQRVALPLYPFARERCWGEAEEAVSGRPEKAAPAIAPPAPDQDHLLSLIYRSSWRPIAAAPPAAPLAAASGQVLIYPPCAADLVETLKRTLASPNSYEIVLGTRTEVVGERKWEVDIADQRAISTCLQYVDAVDAIYFFGGFQLEADHPQTAAEFDRLQTQGPLCLFRLLRAMDALHTASGGVPRLKIVTNRACAVGDGQVIPQGAAVRALARAFAREHAQIQCEMLDLDIADGESATRAAAALTLAFDAAPVRDIAFRNGIPLVRDIVPYDLPAAPAPVFESNGVYVLIGGAGVVGGVLSRQLARIGSARFAWVGRRDQNDEISRRIAEIEALGSEAAYFSADISDADQIAQVLDAVERRWGRIHGVLHVAKHHDTVRLRDLNENQILDILSPKTNGSFVLRQALERRSVGFVALFSSAEAHVGNIGWAPYGAACAFQDAFARDWSRHASYPVAAVNWGYWEGLDEEVGEMLAAKGIRQVSAQMGLAILERVLANREAGIIALDVDEPVLHRMGFVPRVTGRDTAQPSRAQPVSEPNREPAPRAETSLPPEQPPSTFEGELPTRGALTQGLIDLFSRVLKIDKSRFDIDTDLINYGIDSLTVVALHKTFEKEAGSVPATLFVVAQTIGAVADQLLELYPFAARAFAGLAPKYDGVPPPRQSPSRQSDASSGEGAIRLLAEVESGDVPDYLFRYGKRFHDGTLALDAARIRPASIRLDRRSSQRLDHALVDTPKAPAIELLSIGEGLPVLLLPAVGLTAPTWRDQLTSPLVDGMRFHVAHVPGYGLSRPIADCSAGGVAAVVKGVVDAISPDRPVHLVASCLGCVAAIYLARFFPERVASLTLVGAFHDTSDMAVGDPAKLSSDELTALLNGAVDRIRDDFAAVVRPQAFAMPGATQEQLGCLLDALCANALIALRYLMDMIGLPVLDWLPGIEVPTQCIFGTNDKIVSTHHSSTIAKLIPGAQLLAIEGAGHFPYLTHSEQFNSAMEAFIRRHEGGKADARAGRPQRAAPNQVVQFSRAGREKSAATGGGEIPK